MLEFKMILKKRVIILTGVVIFAIILQIGIFCNVFESTGNDGFRGVMVGLQTGLLCSMIILFISIIVRYNLIRKDEVKLKKLYNAEKDERKKEIKQKSGGNVMMVSSLIIIFTGIISGYFNEIAFFSLVGCGVLQLNLCGVLKLYYSNKY
jgi:hypothetical protein